MANAQVTVYQTLEGEEITNVYYIGGNFDPVAEGQLLADVIRDGYVNHLQARLANNWSYDRIDVRDLDVAGQPSIPFVPTGGPVVGTEGGNLLASQIALLISPRSNTPRPNRGRKYLGGFTEASFADGVFTQSAVDDGIAFLEFLRVSFTTIGSNNGLLLCRLDPVTGLITIANLVTVIVGTTNPATRRTRRRS